MYIFKIIKEKTANKTKIKMKITKKKSLKNLNSSKHRKIKRTKLINKILKTSIYNCKNWNNIDLLHECKVSRKFHVSNVLVPIKILGWS